MGQNTPSKQNTIAVLRQLDRKRLIPMDRAVVLVGRSADCDVVITTSQKISRRHCCLVQADQSYFVRDLGSMNGVWLNGKKVKREAEMKAGDRLCIGDVEFQLFTNVKVGTKKQLRTTGVTEADLAAQAIRSNSLESKEKARANQVVAKEDFEILDDVVPLNPEATVGAQTNELQSSGEVMIDEQAANTKPVPPDRKRKRSERS